MSRMSQRAYLQLIFLSLTPASLSAVPKTSRRYVLRLIHSWLISGRVNEPEIRSQAHLGLYQACSPMIFSIQTMLYQRLNLLLHL